MLAPRFRLSFALTFARTFALSLAALLAVRSGIAQNAPPVSLGTSETLFTVLTAINACGYDQELEASDPLRREIRAEVAKAIETKPGAKEAAALMCIFYRKHLAIDTAHDLSQYISLALYLDAPPDFAPKQKVTDMPPDAANLIEFTSLMQDFYTKAGLHTIWEQHSAQYAELTERYHEPLAKMTFDTEIYLKLPSAGYLGRQFSIYIDAMGAPGQTNARNYSSDYYVVISPTAGTILKMREIRHTYLHYLLDPLAMKNEVEFARLHPLLLVVKSAPMDESFRTNITLLVTECLIRAVELRTGVPKPTEAERAQKLAEDDQQGYILTRYFYNALAKFEQNPVGLRNEYEGMLAAIDVNKESKRASQIKFAVEAAPEILRQSRPQPEHLLLDAERKLAGGDADGAQQLAQRALDEKQGDPGRAFFVLAKVATMKRDMEGAQTNFGKAIQTSQEPQVIAWSHIYLGRIFDLKEERPEALEEYRTAVVAAGAGVPEARLAAQQGIETPYQPRVTQPPVTRPPE